jgi:hypothetical protein
MLISVSFGWDGVDMERSRKAYPLDGPANDPEIDITSEAGCE